MNKAEKVFRSMMEKDFCSQWMEISPLKLEEGECHLEMKVKKEMLNGFSILHGGIAYALADSALAFASNSYGNIAPLINGNMVYTQSAKEGDTLRAEAKVFSLSHKKADIDVNIYCNDHPTPFYYMRGTVYRSSKEHQIEG